jgi:hypothetical protein
MKKIACLLAVILVTSVGFSQKKKPKPQAKSATSSAALATSGNLSLGMKDGNFVLTSAGATPETFTIKTAGSDFQPLDCKIKPFKGSNSSLHLVTWTEKSTTKTAIKNEEIVTINNVIYDITNKKQVFSNTQATTNKTEKVFLNKAKTASETQTKTSRTGFDFILNADGSITLSTKNSTPYKMVYDPKSMEYIDKK